MHVPDEYNMNTHEPHRNTWVQLHIYIHTIYTLLHTT